MHASSASESFGDLSLTAFKAARNTVIAAALAPFAAAAIVAGYATLVRPLPEIASAEEALAGVGLALWCSFAGWFYALLLGHTTGRERRGARIAAVIYALGLWVVSSFGAILTSAIATAIIQRMGR